MTTPITENQIQQWRNERAQRVQEAIVAILKAENCDLIAVPQIVDGRIVALVQIVPK